MTTKSLEVAGIHSYGPLKTRLTYVEFLSSNAYRYHPEFSIEHWTLLQFYHLLLEEYKMPEDQAKAFTDLCTSCNVSVKELSALLDEELFERLGNTALPEKTLSYVSLAVIEKMFGRSGYKAARELRKQLVPPKRKIKQV